MLHPPHYLGMGDNNSAQEASAEDYIQLSQTEGDWLAKKFGYYFYRRAAPAVPSFTEPSNRSIFTSGVENTITTTVSTVVTADGVSIGTANPTLLWTPTEQDFDVTLAAGDSALTVSVAEANRMGDFNLWTRASFGGAPSAVADPFGGTSAWRFTATAGTASHNISRAMSPISTVNNSGFETWVRYNPDMPVVAIYPTNNDTSEYCAIHIGTGDKVGNFADLCVVETREVASGTWKRLQFRRGKGTFTTSTVGVYGLKTLTSPVSLSQTMDGTETMDVCAPRSADGVLPFTDYDQMQVLSMGTVTVPTTANSPYTFDCQRWQSRSPFHDRRLDMNANRGHLDVVVPDTYDANRTTPYPVLYVLEVECNPGTAYADGLGYLESLDIHNTYDVILARTKFPGTIATSPWYGNKGDGTAQHNIHMANFVRFMEDHFNAGSGRDDRLAIGFSKSGWGAMSLMLRDRLFGYVASWDVPYSMTFGGTDYGQVNFFGSESQFLLFNPVTIFDANILSVSDKARIVLAGSVTFDADTVAMEAFLNARGISHTYLRTVLGGGGAGHKWDSGWAPDVVSALFALRAS
jgi:hypothetical protein